jgi:hypothetical protein
MRRFLYTLFAFLVIGVGGAGADYLVQQPNGFWATISSNTANQPNVSIEGQKATYSYASGPNTSFAASPTDYFVVTGSATKTIRITKFSVCGTATAATTIDVNLIKRTVADTGGTSTAPTAVLHDSNNVAATSTAAVYTANPTTGAGVTFDVKKLNLGALGGAGCIYWQFGDVNGQTIVLRGIAQQFAFNLNAVTAPAGTSLDLKAELTEE